MANPYSFSKLIDPFKKAFSAPPSPKRPTMATSSSAPQSPKLPPSSLGAVMTPIPAAQLAALKTTKPQAKPASPALGRVTPTPTPSLPAPTQAPTLSPTPSLVPPPSLPLTPTLPQPPAPQTPSIPSLPPEVQKAVTSAEETIAKAAVVTPEELATQGDIDRLITSTKTAYQNTENQPVPLEFITGQLASLEKRAVGLAEPLERKLARLQAARQASIEASKFSLERADKQADTYRADAKDVRSETESARRFGLEYDLTKGDQEIRKDQFASEQALAEKKFEEDKRQFGLEHALNQQKLAAETTKKTTDQQTAKTQVVNDNLQNLQIVNDLLGGNFKSITGVGQNPLNIFGIGNPEEINKFNQLKGILSLENRQKLKGSGAVSDFESKTLERASSALGRNLSNAAFEKELKRIRGVFTTSAGLEADIKATSPSGETIMTKASRDEINALLAEGNEVEYQ